jgi:uncharacterized protein
MTDLNGQQRLLPAAVVAIGLVLGLSVAGYLIGNGVARLKSLPRTVTVKGLVEKEVRADQAIWKLGLRRASSDLKDAQAKLSSDRDATLAFLLKQGFKEEEIEREPTRTLDKLAREYGQSQGSDPLRYVVTASLVVKTGRVDLVRSALGATDELLKSGVPLDGEAQNGAANPRYIVSKFNDLRPQLLAEATQNGRAMAQQFATDSGSQIGRIRSANQGMIQIFGMDGNDESGPYSPTSTPVKKIRVVSTFEFELR